MVTVSKSKPKVDDFLNNWRDGAANYYRNLHHIYHEKASIQHDITKDNLLSVKRYYGSREPKYTPRQVNELMAMYNDGTMPTEKIEVLQRQIKRSKFNAWLQTLNKSEIDIISVCKERFEKNLEVILKKELSKRKKRIKRRLGKHTGELLDVGGFDIQYFPRQFLTEELKVEIELLNDWIKRI